jgi:hypothetical protein
MSKTPPPIPPPPPSPCPPPAQPAHGGNGPAVAGMVLGIISLFMGAYVGDGLKKQYLDDSVLAISFPCGLCSVIGLILSKVGVARAKKEGKGGAKAMARIGILCCWLVLVILVLGFLLRLR